MGIYAKIIKSFLFLTLIVGVFWFTPAHAVWVYVDLFNSDTKSTGDLNGQDGWSGNAVFDVSTNQSYEGDQSVEVSGTEVDTTINSGTFTAVSAGSMYFAYRDSGNAVFGTRNLSLLSGGKYVITVGVRGDGATKFLAYNVGGVGQTEYTGGDVPTSFAVDTWFFYNIEFDDSAQDNKYRIRIKKEGQGWGDWTGWVATSNAYTSVNNITLTAYVTGQATLLYFDTISDTDPTAAPPEAEGWEFYHVD